MWKSCRGRASGTNVVSQQQWRYRMTQRRPLTNCTRKHRSRGATVASCGTGTLGLIFVRLVNSKARTNPWKSTSCEILKDSQGLNALKSKIMIWADTFWLSNFYGSIVLLEWCKQSTFLQPLQLVSLCRFLMWIWPITMKCELVQEADSSKQFTPVRAQLTSFMQSL